MLIGQLDNLVRDISAAKSSLALLEEIKVAIDENRYGFIDESGWSLTHPH